jgi:SAM-dependent methyltransferase
MAIDATDAADFYATRLGMVTARLIRARVSAIWPDLQGDAVLGIGYAAPYLRLWRDQAARTIALTPAQIGAARWPLHRPNLSCTAEEDALPFPDLSFDRVLLVHSLEQAENARRLLREIWRILKEDGRLLVIAPNRSSAWAYLDRTPFGYGHPYSPSQLGRLLTSCLFRVERRDTTLYLPPFGGGLILRTADLAERIGPYALHGMAGVILAEASKDVMAVIPLHRAWRRRLTLAEAA